MKKGCLFDLDGTLVDSLEDLAMSVNQVLQLHHLPTHDMDTYRLFVGNGVRKLMERALGQAHLDWVEECLKEFYKVYAQNCLLHTRPYQGIQDMLLLLKQQHIQMSVVTNKPHALAVKIVEELFPDTFVSIYGQQDLYPTKPSPQSTYMALMAMKLSLEECFFIGDSRVDMETAWQAGMESIGVTWGFRSFQELSDAQATYIIDDPLKIVELIK